jgi:hypothetical protein
MVEIALPGAERGVRKPPHLPSVTDMAPSVHAEHPNTADKDPHSRTMRPGGEEIYWTKVRTRIKT